MTTSTYEPPGRRHRTHPDVSKTADPVIDLGPEGGDAGGYVVVEGTPEIVTAHPESHTGRALAGVLVN